MSIKISKIPEYTSSCILCGSAIDPKDIVCPHCISDLRKLYVIQYLIANPKASIKTAVERAMRRIDKLKLRK